MNKILDTLLYIVVLCVTLILFGLSVHFDKRASVLETEVSMLKELAGALVEQNNDMLKMEDAVMRYNERIIEHNNSVEKMLLK